jgi:hypothetical protein
MIQGRKLPFLPMGETIRDSSFVWAAVLPFFCGKKSKTVEGCGRERVFPERSVKEVRYISNEV